MLSSWYYLPGGEVMENKREVGRAKLTINVEEKWREKANETE